MNEFLEDKYNEACNEFAGECLRVNRIFEMNDGSIIEYTGVMSLLEFQNEYSEEELKYLGRPIIMNDIVIVKHRHKLVEIKIKGVEY